MGMGWQNLVWWFIHASLQVSTYSGRVVPIAKKFCVCYSIRTVLRCPVCYCMINFELCMVVQSILQITRLLQFLCCYWLHIESKYYIAINSILLVISWTFVWKNWACQFKVLKVLVLAPEHAFVHALVKFQCLLFLYYL